MLIALTGALAGLVHVVSGPDHLAAVAPLALESRRRGWLSGWTWGVGHAAGVVAVALLAVLLRDRLPSVEVISAWSERMVGGALIAVGVWALGRALRIAPARHGHDGTLHDHLHVQAGPAWVRRLGHAHASFYLGILHGVAGSSHVFGVLPALALPTRLASITYLVAFAAGTIAGMTAFGAAAGFAGTRSGHGTALHRGIVFASALLAIAVGSVWLASGS